jgi:predicted nucleic acid-binding protein
VQLADTSAWIWSSRAGQPELRERFTERLVASGIATCDQVVLELLFGVHSPEYENRARELEALINCAVGAGEWQRARDVQRTLAERGGDLHKAVKVPDLIIAAAAEAAGIELLHYDSDYDLIQEVTDQPMHWLAPRGTLSGPNGTGPK